MVNYQNGKIYKIIDNTNNNIYVGSTTQTLSNRLKGHIGHYKNYLVGKARKCMSYDILKNNDYKIISIEEYPCENREQLRIREQYWIDTLKCINSQRAYQSKENRKEYMKKNRLDNLEYRINKDRDRYSKNNKIMKEQAMENYYKNKDTRKKRMNELRRYKHTWGGTINSLECNLLKIDTSLFLV